MPAKREIPNAQNIVNDYIAGVPHGKLLKEHGISGCLFNRLLRDAGVKRRTMQEKGALMRGRKVESVRWKPENLAELLADYTRGMSEKAVAEKHSVSRTVIRRVLLESGIVPRGRSAAEFLKWKEIKQSPALIERQCGAAWKAANERDEALESVVVSMYNSTLCGAGPVARAVGTSIPNVKRILKKNNLVCDIGDRRAYGVQSATKSPCSASPYETPIMLWLSFLGAKAVHQYAIGSSNVDIALTESRIAVEVERRYINDSKSIKRERVENILNAGWRLVIVYDPTKLGLDYLAIAQKLVAIDQLMRSDKAPAGQYGVIGRDGKTFTRLSNDLYGWARIEGL